MIKKFIATLGIAVWTFLLSGCDNAVIGSRYYSATEEAVYKAFYEQSKHGYSDVLYDTIGKNRKSAGLKEEMIPKDMFFCDYPVQIRLIELSMIRNGERETLSSIYKKVTGKDACYVKPEESLSDKINSKVEVPVLKKEFSSTKLASVETLRKLAEATQDCNRSRVEVIVTSRNLAKITEEEAQDIIRACEISKIEMTINQ